MFLMLKCYLFLIAVFPTTSIHIFDQIFSTCSFKNEISDKPITVLNKVWRIRGKHRHVDTEINFSLCDLPKIPDCDTAAAVCSINRKKSQFNIRNAGSHFVYSQDERGKNIFKSLNGQRCDEYENFTTIIEFNSYPDIPTEPTFLSINECELKVEMMDPTFTPLCTLNKGGNFIDMRALKNLGNFLIDDPKSKKRFSLNLCKESEQCSKGVSACEITGSSSTVALLNSENQRIVYENGMIGIEGYVGDSKKTRKNFALSIKCNWKVDGINKLQYLMPMQQGKNFRFYAESSLGCIKLPINCMVREQSRPNFLYDLRSLFKSNSNWHVKNVTDGIMNLNICGPLHSPLAECLEQHSQVCLTKTNNINLGSIQKQMFVTNQDTVISSFEDGSVCLNNSTKWHSTEIEFICALVEEGPVLNEIDECVYRIKWRTPAACPTNSPEGENCLISDLAGPVNLNNLHQLDRILMLPQNSVLRYNLCGPLNKPCNDNKEAGVCITENNRERVLGISNNSLVMNNNIISTSMRGEKCTNGKKSEVNVNFHCNHLSPADGQVEVNILEDYCDYEINVHTPTACPPSMYFNCKVHIDGFVYDLSSLSRNDNNYEIHDDKAIYSLNLCRSVIITNNAHCSSHSAICMKNLSEPHTKNMYISLGLMSENIIPLYKDGDLIIDYKFGSICDEDPDILERSSRLRLQCSSINEVPQLFKRNPCMHEFIWRTPKACGAALTFEKTRSSSPCAYTHPVTKKVIDLSTLDVNVSFTSSDHSIHYALNLCTRSYTYCIGTDNQNCTSHTADGKLIGSSIKSYLVYNLSTTCDLKRPNIFNISLMCHSEFDVQYIDERNCVMYLQLNASGLCMEEELTAKETEKNTPMVTDATKLIKIVTSAQEDIAKSMQGSSVSDLQRHDSQHLQDNDTHRTIRKSTCNIRELNNFSLALLTNTKVFSNAGNSYIFNFEEDKTICNGLVCKNMLSILPETDTCPQIFPNYKDSVISLHYESQLNCSSGFFQTEVLLKCKNGAEIPSLLQESSCKLVLQYPIDEVCSLFHSAPSSADSTGLVVGSSAGVVLLLFITAGGFVAFKKQHLCRRQLYRSISKESTYVYARNTQL